jgi:hypothetical protein
MLIARRAILGFALLLAMIGDSSGQSPAEPPRQNTPSGQQRTHAEQRDTDQAPPSIIKKLPAEQTQQKTTADEQKGPQKPSDTWSLSDKIAAIASIVALLQFFALIGTICVLVSTARRQLRAYIFISQAEISNIMSDQNLMVKVVVKNFGQTPAYKATISLGVYTDTFPLATVLPPAAVKIRNTNIGPGGEQTVTFSGEEPTTIGWRQRYTQKTGAIYIYGIINYLDAFGCRKFTNFRLYKGGDAGVSEPPLSFTIDYNEAN